MMNLLLFITMYGLSFVNGFDLSDLLYRVWVVGNGCLHCSFVY